MSINLASFDIRSLGMPTFDVADSPRPAAIRPAKAKRKPLAALPPKVAVHETARQPVTSAAEVERLRMELAELGAELCAIKDAPAAEERRQRIKDLLAADFAWRHRMPGMDY